MNIFISQYSLFNSNLNPLFIEYIINNNIMVYKEINELSELLNNIKNISYLDIEFRYDDNNYRIPYYNNNKIDAIKINEVDDVSDLYNYISSNSLIPDEEILCGERIQSLADVVIGRNSSAFHFNPNNPIFSKELKTINELKDIDNYDTLFVFTHDLEEFYEKFKDSLDDKILISHNSDGEITYTENVKLHLAQNTLIKNKNLIAIPIGIENTQWFDHSIFHRIRKLRLKKTKDIYFNFTIDTHHTRLECFEKLKNEIPWIERTDKENFYKELAIHKYAICPRGNGLDTHRIWECLYLDVIPIIIEPDDVKIYNLPIIILNNWDSVIKETVFCNQQNEKLCLNYYIKLIRNEILK